MNIHRKSSLYLPVVSVNLVLKTIMNLWYDHITKDECIHNEYNHVNLWRDHVIHNKWYCRQNRYKIIIMMKYVIVNPKNKNDKIRMIIHIIIIEKWCHEHTTYISSYSLTHTHCCSVWQCVADHTYNHNWEMVPRAYNKESRHTCKCNTYAFNTKSQHSASHCNIYESRRTHECDAECDTAIYCSVMQNLRLCVAAHM